MKCAAHIWLKIHDTKLTQKKSRSAHHRTNLLGYIFATKACIDNRNKNLLNINISSACPHSMMNFCPPKAEIGSGVWGTPANFNGFRVFASVLHRHGSTEVNQTSHDVWPSHGLLHYVYILGGGLLPPNGILPGATFTLCPSSAFSYIGNVTARHSSSVRQPNFAAHLTRKGIMELSLLVCATYIPQGGHHVGHLPTF